MDKVVPPSSSLSIVVALGVAGGTDARVVEIVGGICRVHDAWEVTGEERVALLVVLLPVNAGLGRNGFNMWLIEL